MTDTLDGITGSEPELTDFGVDMTGLDAARPCQEDGCPSFVPIGAHIARRYCDSHIRGASGGKRRTRNRVARNNEKPPKLVVEVGGKAQKKGKDDLRASLTADGAFAFMNVVATGIAMSGDEICASAVAGGARPWADSVGELSKYQPWLATFFAPAGGENQLGAWLGFTMTTGAILLPILAHHGMLPAAVGAKLAGMAVAAGDAGQPAA